MILRRTFVTIAESADISCDGTQGIGEPFARHRHVTESYINMTVERLREPTQKVCDKLKMLCGVAAPDGDKVASLRG